MAEGFCSLHRCLLPALELIQYQRHATDHQLIGRIVQSYLQQEDRRRYTVRAEHKPVVLKIDKASMDKVTPHFGHKVTVTGKVLTPDDQKRLAEEAASQLKA